MKPDSQRPADAQWASVKGSNSPCFAWTTTVSESYCPRWREAPPSHLPTGPLGSVASTVTKHPAGQGIHTELLAWGPLRHT